MGSVSVGDEVRPELMELSTIFTGGENFTARMKAWSDMKAAHEQALAELNLGQSARQALDQAKEHVSAAQADRAKAAEELAAATAAKAEAEAALLAAQDTRKQAGEVLAQHQIAHSEALAARDRHDQATASLAAKIEELRQAIERARF